MIQTIKCSKCGTEVVDIRLPLEKQEEWDCDECEMGKELDEFEFQSILKRRGLDWALEEAFKFYKANKE
jgi:hypothetical protein